MTRPLLALLLLVLTNLARAAGPVPIGSLPDLIRPMPAAENPQDSASNGDSTLVLWTYMVCPCGQGDSVYVRLLDVISMQGAFITGITPLRLLGPYEATEAGVTAIDDQPVVLFVKDRLVFVASGPPTTRQRAVRR